MANNNSLNPSNVAASATSTTPGTQVKNIVLVHGALADASGWRAVYDILKQHGHHVSLVTQPLTSRAADVAAVRRILDLQDGPVILVGHSYGGALITESGNDPKVKALVYVSALQPDAGESPFELLQSKPAASQAVQFTADGYAYLAASNFQEDFAADLPKADTDFMADSQMFVAVECLQTPVAVAAWHEKPSYAIVATEDRSLSPDPTLHVRAIKGEDYGACWLPRHLYLSTRSRSSGHPDRCYGDRISGLSVRFGPHHFYVGLGLLALKQ